MTQEFRLLTGVHAGARLELNAQTMTLGRSAHADIVINDWSGPEMQLVLEPDGGITLNAVDGSQPAITLASLVPQRFGPVVLCTGPTGAPWPSDLELLQSLLSPTATALQAATRPLSMSRSRVIAALLGISTAVALALWSGLPPKLPATLNHMLRLPNYAPG
ncbi:hypothetical protein [Paraburkholderia bonniea]|uniref:hypothetical protein n=1 Tax=Paraburkholderia bonniea TaxID=2152891 RepID=UPI00129216B7|nr:hypothetical protein [Paraburkholderia bonniea]